MNSLLVRALAGLGAMALALVGTALLGALATYYYLAPTLPDVALRDVRLQVPLRVYTRDGRLIAQIGEQRRIPVRFEEIPEPVVQAFLAAEDSRFFEHGGIDYAGLTRAFVAVVSSGRMRQGGSTITMQLARNMFLTPEKQIRRKLREIFLALRIEREFSKQEILTLYLNKIFLGQRAYGVAAAAEVYYGKRLEQLTLPEIATIAGTTQLPSVLNPITNPERARARRGYVLGQMLDKGYIDRGEYELAMQAPVESREHGPRVELDAHYVAEMVRAWMVEKYGEDAYTAGYRVVTTVDSRMQRAADWSLRAGLLEYDRRHGWRGPVARVAAPADDAAARAAAARHPWVGGLWPAVVVEVGERGAAAVARNGVRYQLPQEGGLSWARRVDANGNLGPAPRRPADVLAVGDVVYVLPVDRERAWLAQVPVVQGALVSLDPRDGALTALAGGFDFFQSKFNRAVQARRQPGSAFKPFVYSAALEHGFTPASVILDAPVVLEAGGVDDLWRPSNDSGRFYGPTRFRDALVRSRNLVSIRLLRSIGVDHGVDWATRFGFAPATLPRNLTLALGTAQLTPLEMAAGYGVFANGGFRVQPYFLQRIEDAAGNVLYEADPAVACPECPGLVAPPALVPEDAASGEPTAVPASLAAAAAPLPTLAPFTHGDDAPGLTRLADVGGAPPALEPGRIAPLVISPANAFLTTDIMRDVIRRGTATRALALKRNDLAGKTGTTNDRRDTWFVGFNADVVAAAWVGFDQERSLGAGEEGGRTALPMWVYFMGEALAGRPERRLGQPPGVVSARISPSTGELARSDESNAVFELFLADRLPGAVPGGTLPAADGSLPLPPPQTAPVDDRIF